MLVNVLMLAAASKSLNCWGGEVGSITTTSNPDLIFAQGDCGAMWYNVSDKANPHLASLPHYTKGGLSGIYLSRFYGATSGGDIVAVFSGIADQGRYADYVVLYSVDTREALAAVNLSTSAGRVIDVAVHNNLLFVVGSKGLAVVNATTGAVAFSAPFSSDNLNFEVKVSPEAKLLYTYNATGNWAVGTVTIRSLDTFALLSSFKHQGTTKILTPTGSPTEVYLFASSRLTKVDVSDPANPVVGSTSSILSEYIADIVWTDVLVIATYTMHNTGDPPDDVRVLDPLNGFSITARSNAEVYLYNAHLAVGDTGTIYCVSGESKLVVFEQQGSDLVMSGESEPSIVDPSAAVEIEPGVMAVMGSSHGVYIVDTHGPMPKVLANLSWGTILDTNPMCVSRKHALLLVQEEPANLPVYLVAYNVSDPTAPAPVWRKEDGMYSCAFTEDVFLLTQTSDSYPTKVEVVDATTGETTDTVVVGNGRSAGVSRGYLFFSSEGDVKAFHISESLQVEPLPDLLLNYSTGNFAYGTDTSMCVVQCDSKWNPGIPGNLSIFMYDTRRDSAEVGEPVQQLDYTNATMSLLSGQTMVVQDFSGNASMMLIYDTSTSPITLTKAVEDEDLVYPNFVMGDTFYRMGGQGGAITFYNPTSTPVTSTPATPAPVTPAPVTPIPDTPDTPTPATPAPATSAAGVPWLIVAGSAVFLAAAAFAGGWFLKSKMKVREVDENSGLCDEIVNDNVQEVE